MESGKLIRLHRYNGWNLLFLLVTGVILYLPALRGTFAAARTLLKYLHIGSGLLSLYLLADYLPLASIHWRRLRSRIGQKANVVILTALLVGWGVTGALLWANRYMPPGISESALVWHDRLSWFAIPWALAHSVTRYFRLRILPVTAPLQDRRLFLGAVVAAAGGLLWQRLGGRLGLPGFEFKSDEGGALQAATHVPISPDAEFQPVPVAPPPAEGTGRKGRFRIYTVTDEIPRFDARSWQFTVDGLVSQPMRLSWEAFQALPRTVQTSDFHCVTGWSVYHIAWEGVRLSDLLDKVGLQPTAKHVKFYSGDRIYTDAVPLEVARMYDVMLAFVIDGAPLPAPLGGPVRLVIPEMYAYKSVKWVQRIELIAEPHEGYWEERGYPADAWLQKA